MKDIYMYLLINCSLNIDFITNFVCFSTNGIVLKMII